MIYENSFTNYGFLSKDIDHFRFSESTEHGERFHQAREAVRLALHCLPAGGDYRSPLGVLAAIGFWQQCIESAQAAIVLADRGMPTPAISVLRTAVENLFYYAALIKQPSLFDRLISKEHFSKHKQLSGMLIDCIDQLNDAQIQDIHKKLKECKGGKDWSAYEAAQTAGLLSFYQSAYRGLSAMGSHATTQSLERHFAASEDLPIVHTQPSDYALPLVMKTICDCLEIGRKIFEKECSLGVLTRGGYLMQLTEQKANTP